MSIVVTLPRRSGQSSPLTSQQWDDTMDTIENAFLSASTGAGSGTVTSVGLSAPAIFTVSGSPVTTTGTLTFALATQTANRVWAGPTSGSAAAPTFRALVANDLPTVPTNKGGTGLTGVGSADQILKMDITGTNLEYADLSAGSSKVVITPSSGDISIDIDQSAMSLTSIGGTLSIAKGGTGATTAQGARLAILPTFTIADAGKVLVVNGGGTDVQWSTPAPSGVTSINALTASAQTMGTGTSGTDFNIVSSGSAHTFNIPSASASNRGLITTGAQTIGGQKTFAIAPVLPGDAYGVAHLNGSQVFTATNSFAYGLTSPKMLDVGIVRQTEQQIIDVTTALDLTYSTVICKQGAAIDVNLPVCDSTYVGHDFFVCDINGVAASRNVTLKATGGQTISGSTTQVIAKAYGYIGVRGIDLAGGNYTWQITTKDLS